MNQEVFSLFDGISFISSLVSLVVSLLAIWLSIKFKKDADMVNQKTIELLIDIRTDSKAITQWGMSELKAYGDSARGVISQNTIKTSAITSDLSIKSP